MQVIPQQYVHVRRQGSITLVMLFHLRTSLNFIKLLVTTDNRFYLNFKKRCGSSHNKHECITDNQHYNMKNINCIQPIIWFNGLMVSFLLTCSRIISTRKVHPEFIQLRFIFEVSITSFEPSSVQFCSLWFYLE